MSRPVRGAVHGASMTSDHRLPPAGIGLPAHLDRDWAHLGRDRVARRQIGRWANDHAGTALGDACAAARSVDDLLDATGREHGRRADAVLVALIDLRTPLAERIVLQRMLPLLLTSTARYGSLCRGGHPPSDVVVGAAWLVLRRYDTVRRPTHVIARLVSDAVWEAFRRPARRRNDAEVPFDVIDRIPAEPESDPLVEFAEMLRDARRSGVGDADLQLLRDLVRLRSTDALARRDDVSTRMVRYRRAAAVRRVRLALGVEHAVVTAAPAVSGRVRAAA